MKILLGVDGSEYTAKAAEYVATHYKIYQDTVELHILHVHLPIPKGLALVQAEKILGHNAVESYYKEGSEAALSPAEAIFQSHGIPFISAYKVGNIADEICEYASTQNMDQIVMGSHGHHAFRGLVLGSVTTQVLAVAKIPVLVVR